MKKRITALLLCCVMLLTLCPGLISTATAYDDTQPDQAEATGETVQPTVNFTNVAPFLPPVSGGVRMLRAPLAAPRAAANFAANDAATDNGMKISKTATRNDNGSYTITLEAYATGSKVITEQKTDIPTDIILVLDQSGSMDYDIYSEAYPGNNHNGTYYVKSDGSYVEVTWCSRCGAWTDGCYNFFGHNKGEQYSPKTSAEDTEAGHVQFYSPVTRLDALKTAVTNFADAVAEKAAGKDGNINTTEDNINHRIAVVGFASKSGNGNNTELLSIAGSNSGSVGVAYNSITDENLEDVLQDMDTRPGQDMVTSAINALAANGATQVDLGMDMAQRILAANPVPDGQQRNRVVIVFTDGAPTSSNGFEKTVANNAISKANTIKTGGATVYSIGIFSGADASTAGKEPDEDYYDDLFWSNYTDAEMSAACNWFMQKVSSNNGTPRTPSYYLSAGDSASLNNIFQQISDQIETGGSSTTLDANAEIRDVVSNAFTMPKNPTDIKLYTAESNGSTDSWKSRVSFDGTTSINESKRTISVSGFSFKDNWCGNEETNGQTTFHDGKKLIIEFTVKPENGFLGGNNVYTNAGAGVYENSDATQPVLSFPQPQVNVPIKDVTVTAKDKNVYLKGEVTAEQLKNGATVKVGGVALDLSKASDTTKPWGLEPWQTEYVDITVTVKDKDGKVISDKLENLLDDTTYTIDVTVKPNTDGAGANGTANPMDGKSGSSGDAKINVFKPELTFKDSTIYQGATPNYANDNYVSVVWKHGNDTANAATMGNAPELTYTYYPTATAFTDCAPVAVSSVKLNGIEVKEYTKFLNGSTDTTGTDKQFTVHVLQPTITATVNDVQKYYGEDYTLGAGANGEINVDWKDAHNHSGIPAASGTKPYDKDDLTLTYSTEAFNGQDGIVPNSDFDVNVQVVKKSDKNTPLPATITTTCDFNKGCTSPDTDGKYTVHVNTCSLTIKKNGCSDLDYHAANNTGNAEYQSFIFEVKRDNDNKVQIAPIKVTVQGNGEVKIVGLPTGTYTVTENQGWSWRYEAQNNGVATADLNTNHAAAVTITNTRTNPYWLSGDNYAINHVGGIKASGTFVSGN